MASPLLTGSVADFAQGIGICLVRWLLEQGFQLLAERLPGFQVALSFRLLLLTPWRQAFVDAVRSGAEPSRLLAVGGGIAEVLPFLDQSAMVTVEFGITERVVVGECVMSLQS